MKNIIIAAVGEWNKIIFNKIKKYKNYKIYFVSNDKELKKKAKNIKPEVIFFIHWRKILEKKFIRNNMCINFHMTNLPYGRGGSPLQNLILLGKKSTTLTAFRMNEKIDAGDYLYKQKLSLKGSAEEIYKKLSLKAFEIIKKILTREFRYKKQRGTVVFFKRRKPKQSEIKTWKNLDELYDFIRMLDAPSYPKAFLKVGDKKIFFQKAKINKKNKFIQCNISING